jgi:hypothetical protein
MRFKSQVAAGIFMICLQVFSYTLMHAVFFGVPHFTLSTPLGRSEIAYTLSCLIAAGFGVFFIYSGTKARRH